MYVALSLSLSLCVCNYVCILYVQMYVNVVLDIGYTGDDISEMVQVL